jgi:hypothetical protein
MNAMFTLKEILWGRRFHDMFDEGNKQNTADMGLFHATFAIEMPNQSAEELKQTEDNKESEEPFENT